MADDIESKIDAMHQHARALVRQKLSDKDILSVLIRQFNISEEYAVMIVDNVRNEKDNQKNFIKAMTLGWTLLLGGLALNYFSYQISENTGSSTVIIFYGIVGLGIITILRGWILYRN